MHEYAGATAVVVLVQGNKLYIANAGDSRAMLCRAGNVVELSHDHKPNAATERARIEGAGGFIKVSKPPGSEPVLVTVWPLYWLTTCLLLTAD